MAQVKTSDAALALERVKLEYPPAPHARTSRPATRAPKTPLVCAHVGRLASLRAAYPELDWRFAGAELQPPTWPPEMPSSLARPSTSKAAAVSAAARRPASAASQARRQLEAQPHQQRRPVLMRPPMVRGPGYRVSSANKSAPCFTMGKRIDLGRNVDPTQADDTPGPGQYDTDVLGMADRPRGPSYSMSARFKLSANADPLVADATPGPGQYDLSKY